MFNSKLFLELPLNSGTRLDSEDGCGCIKGNFALACGFERRDYYRNPITRVGVVHTLDDRVKLILNISEWMLIKGYPQKAKLFAYEQLTKLDSLFGNSNLTYWLGRSGIRLVEKVKTRIVNKEIVNV